MCIYKLLIVNSSRKTLFYRFIVQCKLKAIIDYWFKNTCSIFIAYIELPMQFFLRCLETYFLSYTYPNYGTRILLFSSD